jgi:hypothetical protein
VKNLTAGRLETSTTPRPQGKPCRRTSSST